MSVTITFKPAPHDGEVKDNKLTFPAGLVYLSVSAEASDDEYSGFISGWTRPEVRTLVKAAPDLLEALKGLLSSLESNGERWSGPNVSAARAAIAKATGEV